MYNSAINQSPVIYHRSMTENNKNQVNAQVLFSQKENNRTCWLTSLLLPYMLPSIEKETQQGLLVFCTFFYVQTEKRLMMDRYTKSSTNDTFSKVASNDLFVCCCLIIVRKLLPFVSLKLHSLGYYYFCLLLNRLIIMKNWAN